MIQFISLSSVKINGTYTYIKSVDPTNAEKAPAYVNGQTWLNAATGYSYQLIDDTVATWIQIEMDKDYRINFIKDSVFETILKYINNRFYISRQKNYSDVYSQSPAFVYNRDKLFTLYSYQSVFSTFNFASGTKRLTAPDTVYGDITDTFQIGDIIYIEGSTRNDGYYSIKSLTDTYIEVNESITTESANCFVILADVPAALVNIVSRMIYFDVYVRSKIGGLQSERVGTYSYSTQPLDGDLGYPKDIVSGLDMYVIQDAGGISNYVE
jgi:hypothetical protein